MKKLKKFFTEERVDEIYKTMFDLAMGLGPVLMATHEYERLAVLANDALDLYLKGVISLHEFKLIIAANKN